MDDPSPPPDGSDRPPPAGVRIHSWSARSPDSSPRELKEQAQRQMEERMQQVRDNNAFHLGRARTSLEQLHKRLASLGADDSPGGGPPVPGGPQRPGPAHHRNEENE